MMMKAAARTQISTLQVLLMCIAFFGKSRQCQSALVDPMAHVVAGEDQEPKVKCSLYMAPSSIPNAGFGVFTTRQVRKGTPVSPYPDSPAVIVTDIKLHSEDETNGGFWNHVDYFWAGSGLGEFEADEVSENVFVLGCLSNFHTYLKNLHVSRLSNWQIISKSHTSLLSSLLPVIDFILSIAIISTLYSVAFCCTLLHSVAFCCILFLSV